jgi:SAM-dependent methyltransferase
MQGDIRLKRVYDYFQDKLDKFGATPSGVDYNSEVAQTIRFKELVKLIDVNGHFSVIDFGCGYGAMFDFLKARSLSFDYYGLDMIAGMVEQGLALHKHHQNFHCTTDETDLPVADYVFAGSIFNNKLETQNDDWRPHVLSTLNTLNRLSSKGFAFNMLTAYSDPDRMRSDLYYGDPLFYFDYCKNNFSRDVALLHDYGLYDFTILVRKGL